MYLAATTSIRNKRPTPHRFPPTSTPFAVQRTFNLSLLDTLCHTHHSTMKYSTVCAAFFAAVAAASDVKQLKTDNFKSFIEENDLVLAECKQSRQSTASPSMAMLTIGPQSSPHGAATARRSPPSTRRQLPPSRRRTLPWSRLTAQRSRISARNMALRVTPLSRSFVASRTSRHTVASARPTA